MRKLILLLTVMAVMAFSALPAVAQDRASDTSFGFAGRVEYNVSPSGEVASATVLPDTGGASALMLGTGVLLVGGGMVAYRVSRDKDLS